MMHFFINSASASKILPTPGTDLAKEVDQLIYFLIEISVLASILVIDSFI